MQKLSQILSARRRGKMYYEQCVLNVLVLCIILFHCSGRQDYMKDDPDFFCKWHCHQLLKIIWSTQAKSVKYVK